MSDLVCSYCGAKAFYDGRCGDGPVLTCGCDKRRRSRDAKPIEGEHYDDGGSWDDQDPQFDYADRH